MLPQHVVHELTGMRSVELGEPPLARRPAFDLDVEHLAKLAVAVMFSADSNRKQGAHAAADSQLVLLIC
jgi:hypothetical protein